MKKRDLENRIREMAKFAGLPGEFVGGAKHDKFTINGKVILVPRHREINELTARAILKQAEKCIKEG